MIFARVVQMETPDMGRQRLSQEEEKEHRESNKKPRLEEAADSAETPADDAEELKRQRRRNHYSVQQLPCRAVSVARPLPSMKGHTAFLTFATKCDTYREVTAAAAEETGLTSSGSSVGTI